MDPIESQAQQQHDSVAYRTVVEQAMKMACRVVDEHLAFAAVEVGPGPNQASDENCAHCGGRVASQEMSRFERWGLEFSFGKRDEL